jgi:antitoxin component YwqK of YwqJK toxin-antitoxin module
MIRIPFLILFKLLYLGNFSNQTSTIYFEENWKPTSKEKMIYYTPVPSEIGGRYLFRDYYRSGKLYFEALSTSKMERKFEGLAKFYAENGQLIETATLKNGMVNGAVNSFDEKGKIKGEAVYLNNKQLNALMFYYKGDAEGSPDYDTALKTVNEETIVEIIFDGNIKGIRQETSFIDKTVKSYNADGRLIATAKLNEVYDPIEGTVVNYLYKPMRVNKITHLKKK